MASPELIFVLFLMGLSLIFGIWIVNSAFSLYREKKTRLAKALLIMEIFLTVFIIMSLVTALFNLFDIPLLNNENDVLTLSAGNPVPILTTTFVYNFSGISLLSSVYYLYVFARMVFGKGEEGGKLVEWIVVILAVNLVIQILNTSLLLYSIACSLSGLPFENYHYLVSLSVVFLPVIGGILFLVFYCAVEIPLFLKSLRLWKRVSNDNPHKAELLSLAVMAFVIIIAAAFTMINTFLVLSGSQHPTIVFLLSWVCVPLILLATYRGFFSPKSKK
jgi:hypothetical protein